MSASTSVSIVKIAETGGDLILKVGDTEAKAVRLLVSSAILKQVSDVFVALLGPNFREGQGTMRTEKEPQTIELQDDDPIAMQDMCNLLHLKPDPALHPPRKISPVRILKLVVVVDKYDCAEALRLQCIGLLSTISTTKDAFSAQIVASAAFLLGHESIFREATRAWAMGNRCAQYNDVLGSESLSEILPGRAYDIIGAKQAEFREILITGVPNLLITERACECGDPGCAASVMEGICETFGVEWWPNGWIPAREALEKLPEIVGLSCYAADRMHYRISLS